MDTETELALLKLRVKHLDSHVSQLNLIIARQTEIIQAYERLHAEQKAAG